MSYQIQATNSLINTLGGYYGFGEDISSSEIRDRLRAAFPQGFNFFGTIYGSTHIRPSTLGNISFTNGTVPYYNTSLATLGNHVGEGWIGIFGSTSMRSGTPPALSVGGNSQGSGHLYADYDALNGVITYTWDDLLPLNYDEGPPLEPNAFQIQLINRGGSDFDIVFRYENINWSNGYERTRIGGSVVPSPLDPPVIGMSGGDGTHSYALPVNRNATAALHLDTTVGNTGVRGLWAWSMRNGQLADIELVDSDTENPWLRAQPKRNDFNGDGYADMLWFNTNTRQIAIWSMQGFSRTGASSIQDTVSADWNVVDTGDYDGNGRTDILFRRSSDGAVAVWSMDGFSRTTSQIATVNTGGLRSTTRIAGSGDLNLDGRDDIIFHDENGDVSIAYMQENLLFASPTIIQYNVNSEWTIIDVGDFDGNRSGDILWRNENTGMVAMWLMENGSRIEGSVIQDTVNSAWTFQTTGDFNGDGATDILWRHDDGRLAHWTMAGTTRLSGGIMNSGNALSSDWEVVDATDYDGDGTDDILLRNATLGGISIMTINNTQRANSQVIQDNVISDWQVMNSVT